MEFLPLVNAAAFVLLFAPMGVLWTLVVTAAPNMMVRLWRAAMIHGAVWLVAMMLCIHAGDSRALGAMTIFLAWHMFFLRRYATNKLKRHIVKTMPDIQSSLFKQYLKARMDPETAARMVGGSYERSE